MLNRTWMIASVLLVLGLLVVAGCNPNPQPEALTPIPTLAPAEPVSLLPELQTSQQASSQQAESGATEEPAPAESGGSGDAANGQDVYVANCLPCHGPDGAGGAVGPTLVDGEVAVQPDDFYREVIAKGREGTAMPGWGDQLSTQQIEDVIAFLRSKQ
jgi:mono/diheme cytochrome c family protein